MQTECGVNEDVQKVEYARIARRMMGHEVRDENVNAMYKHLARYLLGDIKYPELIPE